MVKAGGGCGSYGVGGGARRLLQLRLASLAACLLALLSLVQFFNTSGSYRYPALPLTTLDRELYKEINPKLILKKNKPDCSFEEVLSRKETLNTWEIPAQFDNFSPTGLANGSYTPADCNPQFSVENINLVLSCYTGARCEVNVNECEENRTICGHGVCYDTYGSFVCACRPGYTGERCHTMSACASGPCGAGGACVEEAGGGGFRCVCAKGWAPPTCHAPVAPPAPAPPPAPADPARPA